MLRKTFIILLLFSTPLFIKMDCGGTIPGDKDNDGITDDVDNCIEIPNPDQSDIDKDWVGDVCDNCPEIINYNQEDNDQDGYGKVCDCNDEDPEIYPGAPEYCCADFIDSNCDGVQGSLSNDCVDVCYECDCISCECTGIIEDYTDSDCDGIPDLYDDSVDLTDMDCDGIVDGCDNFLDLKDWNCNDIPDACEAPMDLCDCDVECDYGFKYDSMGNCICECRESPYCEEL